MTVKKGIPKNSAEELELPLRVPKTKKRHISKAEAIAIQKKLGYASVKSLLSGRSTRHSRIVQSAAKAGRISRSEARAAIKKIKNII